MNDEVISLLDFLRSLPIAFDSYIVELKFLTWKKCSKCSKLYPFFDGPYSFGSMCLLDYRKNFQESENEYLHRFLLVYPNFFNMLISEYSVFIHDQEIVIQSTLYDYDNNNYVCISCKESDVSQ